jgi:hypothetical protein
LTVPVTVAAVLVVPSTGPVVTVGALVVLGARGRGPFDVAPEIPTCSDASCDATEVLGDGPAEVFEGAPLLVTGDVTVSLELAGQPRFSSAASCACACASAPRSFDTVLRAASIVDALVGLAAAFAEAREVLAEAT